MGAAKVSGPGVKEKVLKIDRPLAGGCWFDTACGGKGCGGGWRRSGNQ